MQQTITRNLLQRFCLLLWDRAHSIEDDKLTYASVKEITQAKYVILGAQHYQEEISFYPIHSYRDLYKVLKLEQNSSAAPFCFQILAFDGANRKVKKAYYSPTLLEEHQLNPLILLPETWLISAKLKNEVVQYEHSERKYICVPQQYKSSAIELTGLLTEKEDAYISLSVPPSIAFFEADEQWLVTQLFSVSNLVSMKKLFLGLYISRQKHSTEKKDWRAFFIGGSAVLFCYLIVTSLYLNSSVNSLKAESTELNTQLSPLLSLIDKTKKAKARAEDTSALYKIKGWEITAWQTIAPLLVDGIRLKTVNFLKTGKIAIKVRSTGVSSSDVLALLINQEQVANAEFIGLIRKRNNFQDFTIMYGLTELEGNDE